MRVAKHPILGDDCRKRDAVIMVDGKRVIAIAGEPIAAALLAAGIRKFRVTSAVRQPPGTFLRDRPLHRLCHDRGRPAERPHLRDPRSGRDGRHDPGRARKVGGRTMKETQVAVIGAGPAGLAAAIEVARAGGRVTVIDENAKPGGQLFKQIHKFFGSREHRAGVRGFHIGEQLLAETQDLNVEVLLDSPVYALFPGQNRGLHPATQGRVPQGR